MMSPTLMLLLATATADDESLSLSQLLRDVEANSPALVAERAAAGAAESRTESAGAWSDPFVAVSADEYAFDANAPMLRFEVSQAIPLPGTISPRVAVAKAAARAAAADVEVSARTLRAAAFELFFRALHMTRSLDALAAQQKLIDEIIGAAQARYAAGGTGQRDVLVAAAEKAELEQQVLVQQRELMVIVARLDELRGQPPRARVIAFVDDHADEALPVPRTLDELLEKHPELLRTRAALDAADARADDARAAVLPDIVVQGMWMQSLRADEPSTAGAMVGVSVPLFYWWKQGPDADAAARERSVVDADRARLLLALGAQWEQASLRVTTARDSVRVYREKIAPATTAAVDSTKAAYAAQSASLAELLGLLRRQVSVDLALHDAELEVRAAEQSLRDLLSTGGGVGMPMGSGSPMLAAPASAAGGMAPMTRRPAMGEQRKASPPPGSMMLREMGGM